jgi:hypothetical protein
VNGHAIYCGNGRRWPGVGAASPDRVSKGNPLARDCIQSVTCLIENGGLALNCSKFR